MNRNMRVRQTHRVLAVVFTATVVVTVVVVALKGPVWVSYVPLPPLALLLFSGLFMLVSWYVDGRRGRGTADGPARQVGAAAGGSTAPRARRLHRGSAIVFVVTVLATFLALAQKEPIVWVSYLPLLPLAALLFSGLYMYALPYTAGRRGDRPGSPVPFPPTAR
ncbi:hypothetical protein [Nocardia sp. NPDC005366]|uniref:hypothetical protein n=1 Tax=Nocardia sp. NPDC005366 TaxID=3156878 RepID=UPI0033BF1D48